MDFALAPGTQGAGIYATSSGSNTDVVVNTFRNVIVSGANQFAQGGGCEGNCWIGVQGNNIGQNLGTIMFQENGLNADEVVIARMESGSLSNADNLVCYGATGSNNIVKLTCDASRTGVTAVQDTGGYNIFHVRTIGSPSLGSVPTSSRYRYVASGSGSSVNH